MSVAVTVVLVVVATAGAVVGVVWVVGGVLDRMLERTISLTGQVLSPDVPQPVEPSVPEEPVAGTTDLFTPPWETWEEPPPPLGQPEAESTPRPPEA